MNTSKLQRGDLVKSARDLDPTGACVPQGTLGVVFEEAGYYDIDEGPMVRWFNGGCCSVTDDDVISPEEE
jgi:hypothetical protein